MVVLDKVVEIETKDKESSDNSDSSDNLLDVKNPK